MRQAWLLLLLAAGCSSSRPAAPQRVEAEGLPNAFRLSPRLYSGGSPEGDAGFRSLAKLGVRTVISVDGARPDVEKARAAGLRYVHLPIGYGGFSRQRGLEIARAVRDLPGPVYIHCHHGKHRGPAAVAAALLCIEGQSPRQVEEWLELAGTGKNYLGLLAVPRSFVPASAAELDAADNAFPEVAEVASLARLMVQLDERLDHLQVVRSAGWKTPPDHPDLSPAHEALLLAEGYREMARLDLLGRPDEFRTLTRQAEGEAQALARALRKGEGPEGAYQAVRTACSRCHEKYRDVPGR